MALWLISLVPLASLVTAALFTHSRAAFLTSRWDSVSVPAQSASYRDPALSTVLVRVETTHATESLPESTRQAAALLRFAICVASVFVVPVVGFVLLDGQIGAVFCLGLPGLALAGGQMVARWSLLEARPSSPTIARAVGLWTILHNLVVVACVVVCGLPDVHVDTDGDWCALAPESGFGVVFVLYAVCSIALGLVTVRAAAAHACWLEANSILSPAEDGVP